MFECGKTERNHDKRMVRILFREEVLRSCMWNLSTTLHRMPRISFKLPATMSVGPGEGGRRGGEGGEEGKEGRRGGRGEGEGGEKGREEKGCFLLNYNLHYEGSIGFK